jgi:hypothetical protein
MDQFVKSVPLEYMHVALSLATVLLAATAGMIGRYAMAVVKKERERLADMDAKLAKMMENHLPHLQAATEEVVEKLDKANGHLAEQTGYLKIVADVALRGTRKGKK